MKAQVQAPLFNLLLAFGGGVFVSTYFPHCAWYSIPFIFFFYLGGIYFSRNMQLSLYEWTASLAIYSLFFCLGGIAKQVHTYTAVSEKLSYYECKTSVLAGKAISERKQSLFGYQVWVQLLAIQEDSIWKRVDGKFQLYLKPEMDSLFEKGDELLVKAYVKPNVDTGKGYGEFLRKNGIQHLAYARAIQVQEAEKSFARDIAGIQRSLSKKIATQIEDTVLASLAQAMFLGDKSSLSKDTRAVFAAAGLSHVLAISGMHVGIIFIGLSLFLFPLQFLHRGKVLKYVLVLIFLQLYMLLTGASPAVVRAVLMLSTLLIFRIFKLRYNLLNLLAISAWMQVIFDPAIVFQVGFQLSYMAVWGLIVFMPLYQKYTETSLKYVNFITACVGVSLIATCCTAPLSIYYFEQFPTYFLLSNLLVSLFSFVLIFSGFLWMICMDIPFLGEMFSGLSDFFLKVIYKIAAEVSMLPHALIVEVSWDSTGLYLLLGELIVLALLLWGPIYMLKKRTNAS